MDEYMRGRAEERASIIEWLRAEGNEELRSPWGAAFMWAATALTHIGDASEFNGLDVRLIDRQAASR